jgi:NitT/TauT family transport system ATP-binding protein
LVASIPREDPTAADVVFEGVSAVFHTEGRSVVAIEDLTVTIRESEFVCIVGPSGSGKSTFLNLIAGFVKPPTGRVRIGERPASEASIRKGYVFQEYALFPWLTVAGNVELALEARGVPKSERRRMADQYLAMVGLEQFGQAYPHQLSGGMKQRTAVVRALAYDPPILLFDEPFAALDAFTRERLQRMIVDLSQSTKKTFVYVTHNISEAVFLADRVLVFSARPGRLKRDVRIDLPHPRDEGSPAFTAVLQTIRQLVEA